MACQLSFQSTPSTRRVTSDSDPFSSYAGFQSTPSTRRVTLSRSSSITVIFEFQSTPSTRRVTTFYNVCQIQLEISIHTLHTEGDINKMFGLNIDVISIHTLHTEGDKWYTLKKQASEISIHTLHTEGDGLA